MNDVTAVSGKCGVRMDHKDFTVLVYRDDGLVFIDAWVKNGLSQDVVNSFTEQFRRKHVREEIHDILSKLVKIAS